MSRSHDRVINRLVVQGPGKPAASFSSLRELILEDNLERLRAAVAYATPEGVRLLRTAQATRRRPLVASVVVTLDGLVTHPQALRELREAYGQGFKVIETAAARSIFHAKAFFFDSVSIERSSIFLGSANLTGQGMGRNTELGIVVDAYGANAQELRDVWDIWWDDLWVEARELTDARLVAYEDEYRAQVRPMVQGDRIVQTQGIKDFGDSPATGVANASALWIDAGTITGGSKNQLEIPGSIASYFGSMPSGSHRRAITLRLGSRKWTDNILTYYSSNGMWRLNINTDMLGKTGELTDQTVFFEREGQDIYQFRILAYPEMNAIRNVSESIGNVGETPTREFGWY